MLCSFLTCKSRDISANINIITKWFAAIQTVIIGPGAGRNPLITKSLIALIQNAKEKKLPLILDGDALNIVCRNPELLKDYHSAILLPNRAEFIRLCDNILTADQPRTIETLCNRLGNVTIVQKGPTDIISNGKVTIECQEPGSLQTMWRTRRYFSGCCRDFSCLGFQ